MQNLSDFNKISYSTHILIFSIFIIHLFFVNFPPVNLEELFSFASQNLQKPDLGIYFKYQANTLGFSYLIYFFNLIFNFDPLIIGKTISAFSYLLIGYGIVNINKVYLKEYPVNYLILLVFLHPLIWNFGFRSTPDLISPSLGFFGLSVIFLLKKNSIKVIISSILVGIAIILKPHSVVFLTLFCIYFFLDKRPKVYFFTNLVIILIIPTVYFLINLNLYDFFLVNNNFKSEVTISLNNFFQNIIQFSGFIALIFFPLSAYGLISYYNYKKFKKLFYILLASLIFFIMGFMFLEITGEMDFGTLGQFMNINIYTGLLMSTIPTLFLTTKYLLKKNNTNRIFFVSILISILIHIILLSLAKPTQRYLISLVPLIILFSNHLLLKLYIRNSLMIIFVLGNILIFNNQYASAFLSQDAINFIKKNNLNFNNNDASYGPLGFHRPVFVERKRTTLKSDTDETIIYINETKSQNSIFFKCRSLLPLINKCISVNKN